MEPERVRERPVNRPKDPEPARSEKQQPSVFDKALEQSRLMQQSPVAQQQGSRQGGEDAQREAEQQARQGRRAPARGGRTRSHAGTRTERTASEKKEEGVGHRIVVRAQLKRDQGGGGRGGSSGGGFGQGGHGPRQKESVTGRLRDQLKTVMAQQAARQFADRLKKEGMPQVLTTQQRQQLVNQMVQFIRVGRTTVGTDELQLGMNATVFRGLRLRLTAKNGKVTVQFESPHADVQALFRRERDRIQRELEAQGVVVADIRIVAGS